MATSSRVVTNYTGADATVSQRTSQAKRVNYTTSSEQTAALREAAISDTSKTSRASTNKVQRTTGPRKQVSTKAASVTLTEQDAPDSTTIQRTPVDLGVNFSFTIKVRTPALPGKVLQLS